MTDPSIPLPTLPARVSPGRAYFQCRTRIRQSRRDSGSTSKGKQRADVGDDATSEGLASLSYDAIYAGIKDSPLFKKLVGQTQHTQAGLPDVQTRLYTDQTSSSRGRDGVALIEELAWCGSTLVWSKGSSIYRKYSFSEDPNDRQTIQQALFAYFEVPAKPKQQPDSARNTSYTSTSTSSAPPLAYSPSSPASSLANNDLYGPFHSRKPLPPWSDDNTTASATQEAATALTSVRKVRVLVILQPQCLRLYYPDGQQHVVPLADKVLKVWAMDRGVLLERRAARNAPIPNWWPSTSSGNGPNDGLSEPAFSTLLDPFEEARPVSKSSGLFDVPAANPPDLLHARQQTKISPLSQANVFRDPDERIIYLSDRQDTSDPIIVTFNAREAKLSVWAYANVVSNPDNEISSFRQRARDMHMRDAEIEDETSGLKTVWQPAEDDIAGLPHPPTLGKRRRSADGQDMPQLSSEPEFLVSKSNGDSYHRPYGSNDVSRRVSALLDRRKSNHNPNSTVVDLLGSLAPAEQRVPYADSKVHDKTHRRKSMLQTATSSSMDRRTSTTRNELSVSLDRMAIGASLLTSHSQTSRVTSSQHNGNSGIADPGQLAAHERQERFDAVVGNGDLERDTSLTAVSHYYDNTMSDIFISRLHSVDVHGGTTQTEIETTVFGVSDTESTVAILLSAQRSLALLRISREVTQQGTILVCTPLRQMDAKAIYAVKGTSPTSRDLLVVDSYNKLSLLTGAGYSLCLSAENVVVGCKLRAEEAGAPEVLALSSDLSSVDYGKEVQVSTLFTCRSDIVNQIIDFLSSLLPKDMPHILTAFWQHYRAANDSSSAQGIRSLQYALTGPALPDGTVAAETMSDWEWLTSGRQQKEVPQELLTSSEVLSQSSLSLCLYAIHLVSEERKLFVATQGEVQLLVPLIKALARKLQAWDYYEMACVDGGDMAEMQAETLVYTHGGTSYLPPLFNAHANLLQRLQSNSKAQDPFARLRTLLAGTSPEVDFMKVISQHLKALQSICAIFNSFRAENTATTISSRLEQLVLNCANEGMSLGDVASLSASISLPIREAIMHCQTHTPVSWPKHAYALLDRADQMATTKGPPVGRKREPTSVKKRLQYAHDIVCDTTRHLKPISYVQHLPKRKVKAKATRFSMDHRLEDVQRMLNYTSSQIVKLPKHIQPTEAELPAAQQQHLLAIANRTLALPVGHGMFFYRATTRPRLIGISIPKVELSTKVLPSTTFTTPSTESLAPEEKTWPYFHSGVATALHIAWSTEDFDASEYGLHKPAELNARHGGFLLGLGLTGQLRSLGTYQAFKYLDPKHEYTSVGLLLGLGAAYMGTADPKVSSTLSVHTAALHPSTAAPLNVGLSLQAAGLFGIGLLHVASADRKIADNILRNLSQTHITGVEHSDGCLEAYAIASGFSYGLVMLGRGNEYGGPSDANILGTFKYLLEGGRGTHLPGAKKNVEGILNAAVTSPAATIALGLTFLQTNRKDVSNLLELPQSVDRLDHVRNDLILLRTVCRHLIEWDGLSCSKASIEALVPPFIVQSLERHHKLAGAGIPSEQEVAFWQVVAGGCLALGLKLAGSAKVEAHSILVDYLDTLVRKVAGIPVTASLRSKLAYRSLQICVNTICLALAAVMAGTGELNVLRRLRVMHGQVRKNVDYGTHMAVHMALGLLFLGKGRFTLGTSKIATAALLSTFYPVFPHTPSCNRFHLQALRHMWVLAVEPRCLVAKDVDSGMSVYLRLKFKLCERAEGQAKDVVTAKYLTAPTLTPSLASIMSIQTDSPRYWPVTLDFRTVKDHVQFFIESQNIFVKRKAGHLPYAQDPRGLQSLHTQPQSEGATVVFDTGETASALVANQAHLVNLIASFQASSPIARTDLRFFCLASDEDLRVTQLSSAFMTNVVMECLMQDKPEAIAMYRSFAQAFERGDKVPVRDGQALAFTMAFYEDDLYSQLFGNRRQQLIRRGYIEQAYIDVESQVDRFTGDELCLRDLASSLATNEFHHKRHPAAMYTRKLLILFLQCPGRSVLNLIRNRFSRMRSSDNRPMPEIQMVMPVILARILQDLPTERIRMKRSDAKLAKLLTAAFLCEA